MEPHTVFPFQNRVRIQYRRPPPESHSPSELTFFRLQVHSFGNRASYRTAYGGHFVSVKRFITAGSLHSFLLLSLDPNLTWAKHSLSESRIRKAEVKIATLQTTKSLDVSLFNQPPWSNRDRHISIILGSHISGLPGSHMS